MGSQDVLGGDMVTITAGRLARARRAERTIRAAFATQRTGLLEPNDEVLADMLRRVEAVAATLEVDSRSYEVRGGRSADGW